MPAFNGTLTINDVLGSIYNAVISIDVIVPNTIARNSLAERFRIDGSQYGDKKLFIHGMDVLRTDPYIARTSANPTGDGKSVLTPHLQPSPKQFVVTLDTFRRINLTVDHYKSKLAFLTSSNFMTYTSALVSMINETKKLYELGLINPFVGTLASNGTIGTVTITLDEAVDKDTRELQAQMIGEALANLEVDLQKPSRKFNGDATLRSYSLSDFYFFWNSKIVNKIRKIDLPTIFHKEGIVDVGEPLHYEYFGNKVATATTGNANRYYALSELDYTINGVAKHAFGGEQLASGTLIADDLPALHGKVYTVDETILGHLVHKDAIKYMSALEVATSWYDNYNVQEQHYYIWGHSTPQVFPEVPVIKIALSITPSGS